jgi:biopolymer transport protein ExbD
MARKRKKNEMQAGELNLTAMIDVAFQLLNFFVITSHPMAVATNLDVFRPSEDKTSQPTKPPTVLRIMVLNGGFTLNDQPVTMAMLKDKLGFVTANDKSQSVLILCASDSRHGSLVEVLDLCNRLQLKNLSVISSS